MRYESGREKRGNPHFNYDAMFDKLLIDKIRKIKIDNGYTLHDLSRITNFQIATLERWLKTNHINKVYAQLVRERLEID
jgi:hypothetical protein